MKKLVLGLMCFASLGCGLEQPPDEQAPAVETKEDALGTPVYCPLRSGASASFWDNVPSWRYGTCETRGSGYTTLEVINESDWAVRVRVGAFWWWTEQTLQKRGSYGDRVRYSREFFGVRAETHVLDYGWVRVQTR